MSAHILTKKPILCFKVIICCMTVMAPSSASQRVQKNRFSLLTSWEWYSMRCSRPEIIKNNIRIYHKCEGRVEKFILMITVWNHQACGVMTNCDHKEWIFLSNPRTNNRIFSLLIIFFKKTRDLKVLRRSPDLFNNVKIGQGQLQLIIKHILFYHIWGLQPCWSSD